MIPVSNPDQNAPNATLPDSTGASSTPDGLALMGGRQDPPQASSGDQGGEPAGEVEATGGNRLERRNRQLAEELKAERAQKAELEARLAEFTKSEASVPPDGGAKVAASDEAPGESDLRTKVDRLEAELKASKLDTALERFRSDVLGAIRSDARVRGDLLLKGLIADGLDITDKGSVEHAITELRETDPGLFVQQPVARKGDKGVDITGKRWNDLTLEEQREILKQGPAAAPQIRALFGRGDARRFGH